MGKEIHRGDIWYVNLGKPREGDTNGKARPCVICQPKEGLESHLVTIAPISSSLKFPYVFLQEIDLREKSQIHYNQLKTISRDRLERYIGTLDREQRKEMDLRLGISVGVGTTSILNIKRVEMHKKRRNPDTGTVEYLGKIVMLFGDRKFKFTEEDFVKEFGAKCLEKFKDDLEGLASFLEYLKGLKFLYNYLED